MFFQQPYRSDWQVEQGRKCPCGGADDYCPCQNVEFKQTKSASESGPGVSAEVLLEWMGNYHIPLGIQRSDEGEWEVFDQSSETLVAASHCLHEALTMAYGKREQG